MAALTKMIFMGGTELPADIRDNDSTVHGANSTIAGPLKSDYEDDEMDGEAPDEQSSRKRTLTPGTGTPGLAKRSKKAEGQRRPVKVTEKLNDDDNRIAELKHAGRSNEYIAKTFVDEGRMRYEPATIGSRWVRIRKVKELERDEMLDDELSDWHEGEDEQLEKAVKAADDIFQRDHQRLLEKKWNDTSLFLTNYLELKQKKYTSKACQERYEALQNNTALIPIERDPDQEGRKQLREARVAEAKRVRADGKDAERRAEEELEARKNAGKEWRARRKQEKLEAAAAREAENAENKRIREERAAGKANRLAAKKAAREAWKAEIEEKRRVRYLEERVYRQVSGGMALNRIRLTAATTAHNGSMVAANDNNNSDSEDGVGSDDMPDVLSDREEDQFGSSSEGDDGDESDVAMTAIAGAISGERTVTALTLENPRSILTDEELKILLCSRGLSARGAGETHPEVVARIAAADNQLSGTELNDLLQREFLKTRGDFSTRLLRLQQYDAERSEAGQQGVKSTDLAFKQDYGGYVGKFASLIPEPTFGHETG